MSNLSFLLTLPLILFFLGLLVSLLVIIFLSFVVVSMFVVSIVVFSHGVDLGIPVGVLRQDVCSFLSDAMFLVGEFLVVLVDVVLPFGIEDFGCRRLPVLFTHVLEASGIPLSRSDLLDGEGWSTLSSSVAASPWSLSGVW